MHRLKVSLLCLLSLSLAGSVFGQAAADPQSDTAGVATYDSYSGGATLGSGSYFNIRYMSGNGVGYQQGYTQIGGLVPFWMGDNAFIGPDVRLMLTNYSGVGGNIGGIGRYYSPSYDRIFGAAAYLDMDQSSNRYTYTQGTFGLETLGQFWDLRANAYYVPGTQDNFVGAGAPLCVSGSPYFSGNNIVFTGQQAVMREQAMNGFDAEFGMPVSQSMPWLRAYAGLYYYHASQVAPAMSDMHTTIPNATHNDPWGFRARLDAWVSDDLLLGVNVTTDSVWGTNVNAVADFRFSGFKPTRYFPQWTTRERMLAPWQRNWRIAVEQYGTSRDTTIAAINPATGNPYFVSFIDNSNPNAGNGTFENPYNSFNHPGGIPNADIILVERGNSTLASPYLGTMKLFDNQLLLGEGGTMSPLPLTASYGACSVNGNFTLPGMDGSGNYPFVSNPGAGPAITLANNNEVSGFNIVNGGGDGIFGNNVNNFNLHNLEITGNAGRGIALTNATGTTTIIRDVNTGLGYPNPNGLGNNAGGGILVSTGAAGIGNLQLTNVFMNSNPQGTQPFGISLTANNGNLATTMNNVHADGNGTGMILTETNRTLTASMTNVSASGNVNDGLDITGTGGTVNVAVSGSYFNNNSNGSGIAYSQTGGAGTLDINVSQLNGNGLDGLNLLGTAGAVTNVSVVNSQLSTNGRDGIHNVLSGGSSQTLLVDPSVIIQNGRDGYYYDLTGGSTLNHTFLNNNMSSNIRSAIYGLMDNSTAVLTMTNITATNSGQNAFVLDANNGSVFTSTIQNTNFNTSGANGLLTALHNSSSATFNMTGVTSNGNVQNGLAFLADNSTYTLTALSSAFNNSATNNGILGTAQNGATANLTLANASSVSGNAMSGVNITANNLSNVVASFANTAINNNITGDGIRLSMDNSPNSSLALSGTTSLNGNGANGLLINASTNTVFTPTLTGTSIQGNGQDGVKMNVGTGATVGSVSSAGSFTNVLIRNNGLYGAELNVAGAGSNSALVFNNAQITNTAGTGPQKIGLVYNVSGGGELTASLGGGTTLANHALNSINGLVTGAGSSATISLDGVNASGNGQSNAILAVTNGGFLNFDADSSTFDNSATGAGLLTSSTGTNSSLNVCLDNSSVSNNALQGIRIDASNGGTASFGVGTLTAGTASNINNNGLEGVLGNATNTGVINFRSIGSHFDGNGTAAVADGANFGADNGTIRTLFYGGSADGNSGNGLRVGPIAPNVSSNNSDLTVSLGNGFSASNNAGYGLVLDGNGANSANLIQDPNSAPIVLSGNGSGPENLQLSGANQVLLQLLGSFNGSATDGVHLQFDNITTAIVSINGLGNGTIDNNTDNGIWVQFNNVKNTAVTVSGYNSISNNGLDGIHIEMNGTAPNNRTKGAIDIQGVNGQTLMDSNGQDGVNIKLANTDLVDPFNSLPGVNLTVLTTTDNESFNACIPMPVVLASGGNGIIPSAALNIDNLHITNTGASGGTGAIQVNGTDSTIVPNNSFITNNTISNTQNGSGIGVNLNETVAPTTAIASGLVISGNDVSGSTGTGISMQITNAVAINVPTSDNLHINNNNVSGNGAGGISVLFNNPTGSVSTANGMQLMGNTVTGNTGNGITLGLTSVDVNGLDLSGTSITSNTGNGLFVNLSDVDMSNVVANNLTSNDNDINGMKFLLRNTSSIVGGTFVGNSIQRNGLDGVNVDLTDGTASTFGAAGNSIQFNNSVIAENGQAFAADGVRLRLYGGSSGNIQFNNTQIGNTVAPPTQSYGVDFILGSGAFPGGTLTTAFTNSNVSGNAIDGVLGVINGTGAVGGSSATVTLAGTTVSSNNNAGLDFAVNNAGNLGLIVSGNSLITNNGSDGIHTNAIGANTTVNTFLLNSSITDNGQVTPPGLGNGMTLNLDDNATGNLTVTSMIIGNTAAGGAQEDGLNLNVNQSVIGSNTNLIANITSSTFANNSVSGIAGNITGNNVGLNPVNGLSLTMDQVVVSGSGGNGVAFNVANGALLQMSVDNSSITTSGQNGMFINAIDQYTLVAIDMADSGLNNNGTLLFPGDGFNATIASGATLNVCAETSTGSATPMSFSGNTGDGFDVNVTGVGTRADIDLHEVIAGADLVNGLLGNQLNGLKADVFDGGELNVRANTTHFDGNFGAGLLGSVNDTNGADTVGRFRIIGGSADNNQGDGYSLVATNTTVGPVGVATLTAQFQADDFGNGISAQNNGGYGLNFVASNPGVGGIVGNLLMTGGSTLLGNGTGTVNVDMNGADQAIIGLSGTFNGSTTGDGIHIDLQNITGLALVSLQGPGEVRNNAGDGIDVSMTNVAQGGVFIGGFTDVSDNGTGNNAAIGQDGIKVTMNNVGLGAVKIDAQTTLLPANIMNVSNNTGNGVNVIINNGSVIDNVGFDAVLTAQQVEVIDYTAPEQPCPTPLPNPLLNIVSTNVSTALGFSFLPGFAIQNLNVDNNGTATAGNLSGSGIALTVDSLAQIVGTPSINNNTITNTGLGSSTTTHDGILVNILGGADVTGVDLVTNDVESNNGNGIEVRVNGAPTLTSLNIADNIVSNQTGTLGVTGNGIVLGLTDAAALATVTIDANDVEGNSGDGFQMLNPNTGATDLTVNFTHNQFIGNGSIVPPSAFTTYPAGGMGIDVVLNNLNATQTTINVLSDATGVNTISDSASFGLFLQATNQAIYNLNVTGTGGKNVFDSNVDAGIAVVAGSFVNPNNSLDPTKFSVGNVMIDNVNITNTKAGSHPSLPNYPFSGDGIGILTQQYAQMQSFVVGSSSARNTTLANNAGDGLRINAIEQSQFRSTLAGHTSTLGDATIQLQQIDATGNSRNGIDIIRRDNALLSWDDATVNAGAALFALNNPVSWQAITDGGSFIHINDVVATSNGINGLNVSTTNAQFPITRIDITDTAPVAMGYNPKVVGHSQYDLNTGRGMQFIASADSILVVNASDTSASDNLQGGILVQTFNRATFGDVLTATPLGDPTSDNSIRSTFNGMLISGNGRSNSNANAHGFEVQANGGSDPFNVSSQSVVNISMTGTTTNARNLFDSNGGDDFRITASRFSANYFNLNRIDMRDTAFVHLNNDGLHVQTNDSSFTQVDLTNASIGYPTASSTQTGLSGDGIDVRTTGGSAMVLNVGNTALLNRFGEGIAAGAADPVNAPDVSIYGNRLNGIVVRNQGASDFIGNVFDTASRFNGNRGYSAEMQDASSNFHGIDHSLFSDNSFEGIAVITNARTQSNTVTGSSFRDVASIATTNPAFQNAYNAYNFLNYTPYTTAAFVLTNSQVENNGGATPYVNSINNVNGLEIDVSTYTRVVADIRNNVFHGNTLDDVATASFIATTGGFNANGTINTTGQVSTPGSIDEVVAGVDRIYLEDTAQLDMRFEHNTGDQIHVSSDASNNPNMGATGAVVSDPNTKAPQRGSHTVGQTSLFQVNAYNYDTIASVVNSSIFTGANVLPIDGTPVGSVYDAAFPGPTTVATNPAPPPATTSTPSQRALEAAIVNIANYYVNADANPPNILTPTAYTQVRLDYLGAPQPTGNPALPNDQVNSNLFSQQRLVIGYTAGGEFTLATPLGVVPTAGDVFRVHVLDTNTFNQFGVAQNVEGAFQAGFQSHTVRIPQGQTATGTGTFYTTNPLAPYFDWPSATFPPY